jgi:hypothetical protein
MEEPLLEEGMQSGSVLQLISFDQAAKPKGSDGVRTVNINRKVFPRPSKIRN